MKQNYVVVILAFILLLPLTSNAQRRKMKTFEHVAVSLNAGTTGVGLEAATPLAPNFALRGGFSFLPFTYSYTYDGYGEYSEYFTVPMKAKVDMFNGKLLVDFFPIKDSRFHITAGMLLGSSKIIKVKGHSEFTDAIEIGDIWVKPDDFGNVSAWIKTNTLKPYVGLGFGRTIPRKRIGFKFELGAIFQGSPKVGSNNTIIDNFEFQKAEDDLNEFLNDYFKVYPYLSFQLSYRIFSKKTIRK